jgi:hypothetical protein
MRDNLAIADLVDVTGSANERRAMRDFNPPIESIIFGRFKAVLR